MVAHTYYRVIDLDHCGQILANRIPTQAQAQEILALLQKDYPQCELAIEPYHDSTRTQTSAKK